MRSLFITLLLLVMLQSFSQAPGGVSSHLVLWAKADAGTSTTTDSASVSTWNEQSVNAVSLIGNNDPLFIKNAVNYNPGIWYSSISYHSASGTIAVPNSSLFVAGIPMAASSTDTFRLSWASDDETQFPLAVSSAGLGHFSATGLSPAGQQSSFQWSDGEISFASTHIFSSGDVTISKAGNEPVLLSGASSGTGNYYYLGSDPNTPTTLGTGEGFGTIAETIIYDDAGLDPADVAKIESYLALKYGVTQHNGTAGTAGNYILSDGSTAWDASAGSNCSHDIIALVRDDASALLQKQSHSADDKLRLYIDALAADNISNAGSITNDASSLLIANNGGVLQGAIADDKPAGIYTRFDRVWKITNNNFADNFSLEIKWDSVGPFNLSDIRLLVSSSNDFSGATVYDGSSVSFSLGSIIVGNISTSIVPMNATVYISIGSASPLTPLPIGISSFTATLQANNTVALNWQTGTATGKNNFTIKRSADAVNWETLPVSISTAGSALNTYNAIDATPYNGTTYYRIKLTDNDGQSKYSDIRFVRLNQQATISLYPNPASTIISIEAPDAELKGTKILSLTGTDLSGLVKIISRGNNRLVLDISALARGSYLVKTKNTLKQFIRQ